MKKMMLLVLSACSLVACATLGQPAFDWTGQNFDDYVLKYGMPTAQYTSSNGDTIYSFKKTCEYDRMKEGETLVTVGEGNLIQSISNPTKCPSYYESPEYEMEQRRQEMERERERNARRIQEQINPLQAELSTLEAEIRLKSRSVEQRAADWENFYKRYPNLLEWDKQLGMEHDPQNLAKRDFEQEQPALRELENRAAQLRRQIAGLQSQLPPRR